MSEVYNIIEKIRAESRSLVRELGFMGGDFAGTSFSPSAVHTLIEVQSNPGISARELSEILKLEKSSVSRVLNKLIHLGMIEEKQSDTDKRSKLLFLSDKGNLQVNDIHNFARSQVSQALTQLKPGESQSILKGLSLYAKALRHLQETASFQMPVRIIDGYHPGIIAIIVEMHVIEQAKISGFNPQYEAQLASDIANLCSKLDKGKDHIWSAMYDDRMLGSISLVSSEHSESIAEIRWLIVDASARNIGIGRKLLTEALHYAGSVGLVTIHFLLDNLDPRLNYLLVDVGFQEVNGHSLKIPNKKQSERLFIKTLDLK